VARDPLKSFVVFYYSDMVNLNAAQDNLIMRIFLAAFSMIVLLVDVSMID
jgi:hypothetical protein